MAEVIMHPMSEAMRPHGLNELGAQILHYADMAATVTSLPPKPEVFNNGY